MKSLKHLISILFCSLSLVSLTYAAPGMAVDSELSWMAMEAKTAIQQIDHQYFLKYVAEEGVVVKGDAYSKEKIADLLNDHQSALYQYLFSGKNSIKHFFDTTPNPDVKIIKRAANSILFSYSSKQSNEPDSIENCYIKIGNTWYLDGIFSCE